jgi:hypothetical protein
MEEPISRTTFGIDGLTCKNSQEFLGLLMKPRERLSTYKEQLKGKD